MALQTRGFQFSPPPLVSVPQSIGKVDVAGMYDRVIQGLQAQNTFQQNPQRLATESAALKSQQAQSLQQQALIPKETEVKGAGLDNDLITEQRRRDKERVLAGMSGAQQLAYDKFGPPLAQTSDTRRLPDGRISSSTGEVANIGGESVPIKTSSTEGLFATYPGIPNGVREFEMMTSGMTPEEKEGARKFQLGLAARPSGAAIQYKEVVGADGTTHLVAVDPRAVGAHVVGTGETYGSGVSSVAKPAEAGPAGTAQSGGASAFTSPTIGDAESQKATAQSQAKLQAERQEKLPKVRQSLKAFEAQTDTYLGNIDKAIALVNGGHATGWWSLAKGVPKSDALALATVISSIQSRGGFTELSEMRQNSPTGGALGNVSDNENTRLDSANVRLEQAQDDKQMIAALNELRSIRAGSVQRLRDAYSVDFGLAKDGDYTMGTDELLQRGDVNKKVPGAPSPTSANPADDILKEFGIK